MNSHVQKLQGFRRLGVGALLLEAACDFTRARRLGDAFLHVEERNSAAISIYKSAGFRRVEESSGTKKNRVEV